MSSSAVFARSRKKKIYACLHERRFEEGRRLCEELCRQNRLDPESWLLQGAVYGELRRFEEAITSLKKAIALDPDYTDAHYNLGQAYLHLNRPAEAAECYRQVVRLKPDHADAHNNLGHALELQGLNTDALACFRRAVQLKRDHADAWYNLGNALLAIPSATEGIECLRNALSIRSDFPKARISLGYAYINTGALDEARSQFDLVQAREPENLDAIVGRVMIHEKRGEFDPAWHLLQSLGDRGESDPRYVIAFAKVAGNYGRHEEAAVMLEKLLADKSLEEMHVQSAHFLLGKLMDKLKRYDEAFRHYQAANRLKPAGPDHFLEEMRRQTRIFTPEFLARAPRSGNFSERPLFIVGMPRSGTTLVEQILSSHPAVFGAGELDDIGMITKSLSGLTGGRDDYPDCLTNLTAEALNTVVGRYLDRLAKFSTDALRVTDKMPHNFMHLGLIALMFPGARVIHCRREPLDNCLSIFTYDFNTSHAYTADLTRLGTHYRHYRELMEHWKRVLPLPIFDVQYEEMVADQERMTRALLEFAGLPWDERCLRFYENKRVVNTISYDQVRRPIYTQSVARWRHYERYLGPLIEALGQGPDATGNSASGDIVQ